MKGSFGTLLAWVMLAWLSTAQATLAQIQGLPASDVLGVEDLWENPTFVGAVANNGPTAHSEF